MHEEKLARYTREKPLEMLNKTGNISTFTNISFE